MNKIYMGVVLGILILLTAGVVLRRSDSKPHSVTLTWDAVGPTTDSTAVGYNVYRKSTAGGHFVRIARVVSSTQYEDRFVNANTTYFYAVSAIDQKGRESRLSAQIAVKVP